MTLKNLHCKCQKKFTTLCKTEVFALSLTDSLEAWNFYLDAFPEGTNEIYRTRRAYDGSYDRNVIRQIGHLVTLKDGGYESIWDTPNLDYPFDVVAEKMRVFLATKQVLEPAQVSEKKLGHVATTELLDSGALHVWNHFHADVNNSVLSSVARSEKINNLKTNREMFLRSLELLSDDALEIITDLIDRNACYRIQDHKQAVARYIKLRHAYEQSEDKQFFEWSKAAATFDSRIAGTAVGVFIRELGIYELEEAVRRYESMMAPSNYQRPVALFSKKQAEQAIKALDDAGLTPALERRHASFSDVSVNDVIWVNNDTVKTMKGSIEDLLSGGIKSSSKVSKGATELTIDEMVEMVFPSAKKVEVLFKSSLKGNLVSLTAGAQDLDVNLFKWDNHFALSYNGDFADSAITERVKSAGGNTEAAFRVSLAWDNTDDLDLHCRGPEGHIHFGNKQGILDIDANAGNVTTTPVENMQWASVPDGTRTFKVNQYTSRNSGKTPFRLEVAYEGTIRTFNCDKVMKSGQSVEAFTITHKGGKIADIAIHDVKEGTGWSVAEDIWNITTNDFVEVSSIFTSPNRWEGSEEGSMHHVLALVDCLNPDPVRCFYNEYLHADLKPYRKQMEMLGNKTKAPYSDDQVSGLGFSHPQEGVVTMRVTSDRGVNTYDVKF